MTTWDGLAQRNQQLQRQLREAEAERVALAAKVADAWDEGHLSGRKEMGTAYVCGVYGVPQPDPTLNPYRLGDDQPCHAHDTATDKDGNRIGDCTLPAGHPTGWHQETRDGQVWAEWRGPHNGATRDQRNGRHSTTCAKLVRNAACTCGAES